MEITGRVPLPAETVTTKGLRFTVLGSDERQIKRVLVESVPDDAREDES
jgi:CBS domain containing-hemolysin-like protein